MPEGLPDGFVDELVSGLRSTLGSDLVGVYLHGSAAAEGFHPGVSDIDLLVVTARDLDAAAVDGLAMLHGEVVRRHPDWDDRLELVYVGRETLARFREGGRLGVISPGEAFHVRDGVELWIANFFVVLDTGVALVGPEPSEVIPPISRGEFVAEIRRYAREVGGRDVRAMTPAGRAYSVLTMCRALATVEWGRPCSKPQGAALVRSEVPEWAWLIDQAERCRLSGGRYGLTDEATVDAAERFVALLGDRIAATADGAQGAADSRRR